MHRSTRALSVLAVLAFGVCSSLWPASARPSTPSRSSDRAVVHGRDVGASRKEATSFDLFGDGTTTKGTSIVAGQRAATMAPQPVSGFDALADPDSRPSDTTGAIGDDFIVAAVNTQVAVYDRNGTVLVAPIQLEALHADANGHFVFDPKVVYDPYADTFVLAFLVQEDTPRLSRIITVAMPNATADDTSTWCENSFPGDALPGGTATWADYPGLGYTDTSVTITANEFTFPSFNARFRSSQVMSIDKGGLYDCSQPAPVPTVFAGTATRDDRGFNPDSLRPAETVGSSPGAQLMVSFSPVSGRGDYLTVWRIQPTASGFRLRRDSLPLGRVAQPPAGTQQGGGLGRPTTWWDPGDNRFINASYDADRNELFTAHALLKDLRPDTSTGAYPEAAIRWYEIDPATNLRNSVIARRGTIGAPEIDVGWPSVATNASGVLFVTYSRASEPRNEFLSAWVSTIQPTSTADTELLLHAGAATYSTGPGIERWGDYTAINRDPASPQDVATFNQYAQTGVQWRQLVAIVTDG